MTFFFDVGCPFSYLAAERVERMFGAADWVPASAAALDRAAPHATLRAQAESRAAELRLPLVWPDVYPGDARRALRIASYASEIGAGGRFALAASRLAFCGGFDLEDPEILAEAAAAAGISLDDSLAAAADETRDGRVYATSRSLLERGVRQLPAVCVEGRWFAGERGLAGALAAVAAG